MKIKLIDFGYTTPPYRAHENDAGADVASTLTVRVKPQETVSIPLGYGLELPDGLAAFVFPRSGMSSIGAVTELPPIDAGYRGEIHAILTNNSDKEVIINEGDRVGQIVIMPIVIADFVTKDIKQRGTGAFASTGK